MNRDPFRDLWLHLALNNPRACLLDPRHPLALACVIGAILAVAASQLMAGGG
jgi:hypothetical protein